MTDLADLQTAVRQIPGVAVAVVRWPDPLGPANLRVEFAAGADRRAVTEAVVRTMVEVGRIDLETMQVHPEQGKPAREGRPIFTDLLIEREGHDVRVQVTLAVIGRTHVGTRETTGRRVDMLRMTAEAAVAALNDFVRDDAVYDVSRIDRIGTIDGDDDQVTVQVKADDQLLLGAALVRGDAREAVVRATLDAVNRHVVQIELPA
jgi:hypothetical protein